MLFYYVLLSFIFNAFNDIIIPLNMKKTPKSISNPDELNKNLQYTSPFTWIILGASALALIGFFVWSCLFTIKVKVFGNATVKDGEVVLVVEESNKNKLAIGQKIIISDKEGSIISIDNNEPVVSRFDLEDGNYTYTLILEERKPIDFLLNKK